jgi:hypothetical protein
MDDLDIYETDYDHPVPNIDVIDVNTVKKGGGSDLFIVVASPLHGDDRSLKRLLRKVERYLEFLNTEAFHAASGIATTENTKIIVKIHPDSAPGTFDLLEKCKAWVNSNNATLSIDTHLPGHVFDPQVGKEVK